MQSRRIQMLGNIAIIILFIAIVLMSISAWAKPYNSVHNIAKSIVKSVVDTTQTIVITDNAKDIFAKSRQVDTLAINTAFLKEMRENGELLSSNEFASRITDYYNTLVAVLTALFVLFTIVTYMTIRNKYEQRLEDKARKYEEKAGEIEKKQRQNIIEELRNMLNDSKKIDEEIKSAIGGHIDDQMHEEIEGFTSDMETYSKSIASFATKLEDINKKQQELFKVVSELQDQVSDSTIVLTNLDEEPMQNENDNKTDE